MGSKSETLQRVFLTVMRYRYNLNTNATIAEYQSKIIIGLARGKSTRNFGFEQDFNKMSLERKCPFSHSFNRRESVKLCTAI